MILAAKQPPTLIRCDTRKFNIGDKIKGQTYDYPKEIISEYSKTVNIQDINRLLYLFGKGSDYQELADESYIHVYKVIPDDDYALGICDYSPMMCADNWKQSIDKLIELGVANPGYICTPDVPCLCRRCPGN